MGSRSSNSPGENRDSAVMDLVDSDLSLPSPVDLFRLAGVASKRFTGREKSGDWVI